MHLVRFDSDAFLRDHWQKHPLLIRNPWERWQNPLSPDDLAGLACEAGIEARLVSRARGGLRAEHGPFAPSRFGKLGKKNWTLLVQAIDHHVPAVAALIAPFRFVPNWRIDDVMVSYASDGGGVGAHFDQYDVFLVQGLGRRRWRIGAVCDEASELLPHDDLRLLADFAPVEEWVLEPGDILYVPPGVAHEGVAIGDDCMTYSIGFRAPSRSELIAHWSDHVLDGLADDDRFTDRDLTRQGNPGEIAPGALDRLQAMVADKLLDRDAFARWFGEYNTAPKYPDIDWSPEAPIDPAALRDRLDIGIALSRNPASRFAFIARETDQVLLYVDGESFDCSGEIASLARQICAQEAIVAGSGLPDAAIELLAGLINRGSLALEEEG